MNLISLENGVVLVVVYGTYNHRRRVIKKITEIDEKLKGGKKIENKKRQEEFEVQKILSDGMFFTIIIIIEIILSLKCGIMYETLEKINVDVENPTIEIKK